MDLKAILTAERSQFDFDIALRQSYRFMGWTTQERRMDEMIKRLYGGRGEEDSIRSMTAELTGHAFSLLTPVAMGSLAIYYLFFN